MVCTSWVLGGTILPRAGSSPGTPILKVYYVAAFGAIGGETGAAAIKTAINGATNTTYGKGKKIDHVTVNTSTYYNPDTDTVTYSSTVVLSQLDSLGNFVPWCTLTWNEATQLWDAKGTP